MKRAATLLALLALLFASSPADAQLKRFLRDLTKPQPAPSQPGQAQPKPSKTESLIFGGLKTLQGLMPIGYQEELAIGGAVALEAVARFGGLWENPEVEKYVATVGAAVASTSDRPEIPYYFGILNAEEPNGFACPGGYVFISKGLLRLVQNEAQLAAVLGHEIAHVSKKHALEQIRRSKALGGVSEVTLTALDKDPKMFDSLVKEAVNMILENGIGREKELEADATGTEFAFRVGYDPSALKSFLTVLRPHIAPRGASRGWSKTHPDTQERINRLSQVLLNPEFRGSPALPLLADRYAQTFSNVKL
jgi:beta-barrel assembly-enhancing protease